MRRNCNLELRLLPYSDSDHRQQHHSMMEEASESPQDQHQPQQITIFYNGRVCVSDVTEFQARSILLLANSEMDEKLKTPTALLEPSSPNLQSQLYSPTGLSMTRSLQRFLQKRKHRIQATSPYHH